MLDKKEWIEDAMRYVESLTGVWEYQENLLDLCECLHYDYVEVEGCEITPKEAFDIDREYW